MITFVKKNAATVALATVLVVGCTSSATAQHVASTSTANAGTGPLTLDPNKDYGDLYADGILPVGDGKYNSGTARKGYYDACQQYAASLAAGGGGASSRGPWFTNNNTEYDVNKKAHVAGSVDWSSSYRVTVKKTSRVVKTNDLPTHQTGVFPVRSDDPAYQYDRNPNSISAQSIRLSLTASPKYGAPKCGGGVVGVMTTGVMLFNALDAGGRDAGAWEVQDSCSGHPQRTGEYHYHTLSSCIAGVGVHRVIGWALDGFPITGPKVGKHNILTTRDLDKCHGITSSVRVDGAKVKTYHYVMTQDYPYSVSCFRATPVTVNPA